MTFKLRHSIETSDYEVREVGGMYKGHMGVDLYIVLVIVYIL